MKKLAAIVAVMALCSTPVLAAQQGGFSGPSATQTQGGGFVGPNGSSTTVESAKSLQRCAGISSSAFPTTCMCLKMRPVLSMWTLTTSAGTA